MVTEIYMFVSINDQNTFYYKINYFDWLEGLNIDVKLLVLFSEKLFRSLIISAIFYSICKCFNFKKIMPPIIDNLEAVLKIKRD